MTDLSAALPDSAGQSSAGPDMPIVAHANKPDSAEHGPARPPIDRTRYQIPLNEVARRFMDAGLPRSEKTLRRYCTQGKLDAVQSDGPTSREQWYVREGSISPLIGELLQIHGPSDVAGHSAAVPNIANVELAEKNVPSVPNMAAPWPAEPNTAAPPLEMNVADLPPSRVRALDLDIYDHPYVRKLEDRIERLETKYEAQVRRTEEIQLKAQERLVDLQRMTTIGQSKTLADFMLQAKNWIVGTETTSTPETGSGTQTM